MWLVGEHKLHWFAWVAGQTRGGRSSPFLLWPSPNKQKNKKQAIFCWATIYHFILLMFIKSWRAYSSNLRPWLHQSAYKEEREEEKGMVGWKSTQLLSHEDIWTGQLLSPLFPVSWASDDLKLAIALACPHHPSMICYPPLLPHKWSRRCGVSGVLRRSLTPTG